MSAGSRAISSAYEGVQRNDVKIQDCRANPGLHEMNWAQKAITGVFLSAALTTATVTAAVPTTAPAQPPPKSAAQAGSSNRSAGELLIIRKSDGTFTIQKKPRNGSFKGSKAGGGLVIPPQVVVPLIPATRKKP